jgi:hypothetical protein
LPAIDGPMVLACRITSRHRRCRLAVCLLHHRRQRRRLVEHADYTFVACDTIAHSDDCARRHGQGSASMLGGQDGGLSQLGGAGVGLPAAACKKEAMAPLRAARAAATGDPTRVSLAVMADHRSRCPPAPANPLAVSKPCSGPQALFCMARRKRRKGCQARPEGCQGKARRTRLIRRLSRDSPR